MLVGHYVADMIVEERIVVELKVARALNDFHLAQCVNYLRASNLRLALILNFAQARLEFRRVVNNF
jgi:GxxExxY protein